MSPPKFSSRRQHVNALPSLRSALLLFASLWIAGWFLAEAAVAAEPPSTADLAWLAGDWRGEMGGGLIEEIWSTPAAGTLVGMFRWTDDDAVRLYELMSIEDTKTGPVLYLRHFSAGLKGWEEKDTPMVYQLDAYGDEQVSFLHVEEKQTTRLTYERTEGGLEITLDQIQGAEKSTTTFIYTRR